MRLDEICAANERTLSFEFFPPKNDRGWYTLEDSIGQLSHLGADYVSVTYGAGGSTREKTREIVEHIQDKTGLTAMAHLTCVDATRDEIRALLDEYHAKGIRNILALRGDPPKGETRFTVTPGGCANATELLELLAEDGRFATACAAYPEGHPDSPSREADWANLSKKFAAGACLGITQCFFDAADYTAMVDWLAHQGPAPRIVPGILPVTDFKAVERFCQRCQANIPPAMAAALGPLKADAVRVRHAGIAFTISLCRELLERGAPGLHIYCLNRSTAAAEIVTALRLSGHLPRP